MEDTIKGKEIKARGHKIFLGLKLHDIPNTVKKAMEVFTSAVGVIFYRGFLAGEYVQKKSFGLEVLKDMVALKKSKPGVIITIAREHAKI